MSAWFCSWSFPVFGTVCFLYSPCFSLGQQFFVYLLQLELRFMVSAGTPLAVSVHCNIHLVHALLDFSHLVSLFSIIQLRAIAKSSFINCTPNIFQTKPPVRKCLGCIVIFISLRSCGKPIKISSAIQVSPRLADPVNVFWLNKSKWTVSLGSPQREKKAQSLISGKIHTNVHRFHQNSL